MSQGPHGRSDTELLAASRETGSGFEEFYLRHRDAVLAFHVRRTRDPESAADLTAETFAAALVAVHTPDRALPSVPVAWLFTIADRKLIDSYRRGRADTAVRRRLAFEPLVFDDAAADHVAHIADTTDLVAHLDSHLPPDQAYAVRARFLEGRGYDDIAHDLDCSPVAVRMRVSRALKALRKLALEGHP